MKIYIHLSLLLLINLVKTKLYLVDTELQENSTSEVSSSAEDVSSQVGEDYGYAQGPCKPGSKYFSHRNKCIKAVTRDETWPRARSLCQREGPGGELVSIPDRQTNEFLRTYLLTFATEGHWHIGGCKNNGRWEWTDRTAWWYANWNYGEPNNLGGHENYAEFYPKGTWNDVRSRGGWSVCQYNAGPRQDSRVNPKESACNSLSGSGWRWVDHTQKCYKYFGGYWDFNQAKRKCMNEAPSGYQGNLAAIPDSRTNNWLKTFSSTTIWVGACKRGWSWYWLDQSPWGFTSWGHQEPSGGSYMAFRRGVWDAKASSSRHCAFCSF